MPRISFWLAFVCLLFSSAFAQFHIERASEDFAFQQTKKFTPYTRSHFNRVEGLYLNIGAKIRPQDISGLMFYGDIGHGFKNEKGKRLRWNAGLEKKFYIPNQLTLGINHAKKVDSNDYWLIGNLENSFYGIFSGEDYLDYFSRKGGSFFADYRLNQAHTLRLELADSRYETLQKNTHWTLFGDGDFTQNTRTPFAITEGKEKSVKLIGIFDWRDNPIFPFIGWYADIQFEKTFDDFETTGIFATLKRYQPAFSDHKLQAKLLLGTRSGSFAYQYLLPLGGIGNLRGYDEKEFIGNRLIYLSANYIIGPEWLQNLPLRFIPMWDAISIGVFAETGLAWLADPDDADAGLFDLGNFEAGDLRNDFGLSIYLAENLLRLDFARRTDRGDDNWRILFRILDKF